MGLLVWIVTNQRLMMTNGEERDANVASCCWVLKVKERVELRRSLRFHYPGVYCTGQMNQP